MWSLKMVLKNHILRRDESYRAALLSWSCESMNSCIRRRRPEDPAALVNQKIYFQSMNFFKSFLQLVACSLILGIQRTTGSSIRGRCNSGAVARVNV